MSSKKKNQKKAPKDAKDKEKQKMEEQEAKREKQRKEAQERIQVLEKSGILDAYEYFLRATCKNGLPEANIFQFAAQQILKYEKKTKQKQAKRQQLIHKNNINQNNSQQQRSPVSSSRVKKSPEKVSVLPFKGETRQQALKVLKKK